MVRNELNFLSKRYSIIIYGMYAYSKHNPNCKDVIYIECSKISQLCLNNLHTKLPSYITYKHVGDKTILVLRLPNKIHDSVQKGTLFEFYKDYDFAKNSQRWHIKNKTEVANKNTLEQLNSYFKTDLTETECYNIPFLVSPNNETYEGYI